MQPSYPYSLPPPTGYASSYTSSPASSTTVSSPQGAHPSVSSTNSADSVNRAGSNLNPLRHTLSPVNNASAPAYVSNYHAASTGERGLGYGEAGLGHPGSHGQPHPVHPALANQKRAYRQRRKDPSCDACRERKVKCDATDTSSCTECTSRNVRCQFTKDTNRRMSSMKQISDLQHQLEQARQQVSYLRSITGQAQSAESGVEQNVVKLPDLSDPQVRRQSSSPQRVISRNQHSIRNSGREVTKIPWKYRDQSKNCLMDQVPTLPPKDFADQLVRAYLIHMQNAFPVIHWTTFMNEYNKAYAKGTLRGVNREWCSLLFAVFAIGQLFTQAAGTLGHDSEFFQTCMGLLDTYLEELSSEQARILLLASIYLYEVNIKASSWIWLGSAIRIAQAVGLHQETDSWTGVEGEMKRRLWWGLYIKDRLMSLEFGKPVLSVDQDCDVDLPRPTLELELNDFYNQPDGFTDEQRVSLFKTHINVARALSQLNTVLRGPVVSAANFQIFDDYLNTCAALLPPIFHQPAEPLDAKILSPAMYLQNARLLLYCHNIRLATTRSARTQAFNNCTSVIRDTARLISRVMLPPASYSEAQRANYDWQTPFSLATLALSCTHLWRTILLLLLKSEYELALTCIHASATLGTQRAVNSACGHHIGSFLECLVGKVQRDIVGPALEEDEDLLAFISSDLPDGVDPSENWAIEPPKDQAQDLRPVQITGDPANWEWIAQTVRYLQNEQRRRMEAAADGSTRLRPPGSGAGSSSGTSPRPKSETSPSSNSRMAIASII